MRRILTTTALAVVSAFGFAPAASAATFLPGSPNFTVRGDIFSGPISADFGNSGIAEGTFQDIFQFIIPQTGVGSGSLSTSTTAFGVSTDTDITSVLINGLTAARMVSADGLSEFFSISNVPITSGAVNQIVVNGVSRGQGSFGGNATFVPSAVPEPATWAFMLIGFGAVGYSMRKRPSGKITYKVASAV